MSPLWTQGLKAQSCVGMEEARVHSQSRARKHNENPARGRLSVKGGLGSWARHSDTATDQAPLVSHQQGTKRESPPTALQAESGPGCQWHPHHPSLALSHGSSREPSTTRGQTLTPGTTTNMGTVSCPITLLEHSLPLCQPPLLPELPINHQWWHYHLPGVSSSMCGLTSSQTQQAFIPVFMLTRLTTVLRSLLTSQRNDLLSDKELDGLLLPVIHVAVQLVSVHP